MLTAQFRWLSGPPRRGRCLLTAQISIAPDFDYALVQIDGQAVILAKDLVESVMQRIGVSDYTILGTVKGAELELLRFTHPFMDFDVPAILGDHVTLDAGTGAVHTAPATVRTTM